MSAHIPGSSGFHFGDRFMSRLIDFEPDGDGIPDAAAAPEPPAAPAAAPDGGGGPEPAASPPGAAGDAAPAASPAAPPAIDWGSADAQAALQAAIDQREQNTAEAQRQAELAAQRQGEFSDIEEAFEMLGVAPDRMRDYLGRANPALAQAAQQFEQQQVLEWVDGQLKTLAATHPDLLGDGIAKLSEFVTDDGAPIFNSDDISLSNRNAVLFAASALQQAGIADHSSAITEAAKQVTARDEQVGKIAVERYKQSLRSVGTAPNLPSGGGTGGSTQLSGLEGGDELAVARRINAERATA